MTTHRDIANLVGALYGDSLAVHWVYRSDPDASVVMGIVRFNGFWVVACRGTYVFQDWLHDLNARPMVPTSHPAFGQVHRGFYLGTPEAWDIIRSILIGRDLARIIFAGHSLGAARANLLAAHAVAVGLSPVMTLCWGEPRSGFPQLATFLKGVPGRSYVNVVNGIADGVTQLPPPVGYVHRVTLTTINSGGIDPLNVDPFARHHFDLYLAATPAVDIADLAVGVPSG